MHPIPACLSRFKAVCPFLNKTSSSQLRSFASTPSPLSPAFNRLTAQAIGCPVMGPALEQVSVLLPRFLFFPFFFACTDTTRRRVVENPRWDRARQSRTASLSILDRYFSLLLSLTLPCPPPCSSLLFSRPLFLFLFWNCPISHSSVFFFGF